MFSRNFLAFSIIQWMLSIWSLVLLPFLNPFCISGISQFTYCWSLAWRILSITLLACEMMLWKCCTQYASKFGKLSSVHRTGKGPFSIRSQRKAMPKNVQTIAQLHTSKVMLKILQTRLQQYMNHELPDVQAGFRNTEEPEIKLPTSVGSSKKQDSSRKTFTFALLTTPKPLTAWITNCGKFWKRWEYQTTLPASWEICMQVKKQQLELDMEQQTGSKSGKEYVRAVYCHPAYLTYMQSPSW